MREDRAQPVRPERELTIHLARVSQDQIGGRDAYFKTVHDAYTNQYLHALGVQPSEHSRRMVARHAPLDRCEIEATWARGSSVASELRVVQPPPGGFKKAEKVEARPAEGDLRELEKRHGAPEHIPTDPPHVPDAREVMEQLAQLARATTAESGEGVEEDHFASTDAWQTNKEEVDGALVEELERVRRLARGENVTLDGAPELIRWGEDGERELASLKRRFILPFAAQRPAKDGCGKDDQALVPWQSPELRNPVQVPNSLVEDVVKPLAVSPDTIAEETATYIDKRFPLELLTTRRDPWQFEAIRELLRSPEAVQLTGLLAHLAYWTMFSHVHRPRDRLPEETHQNLTLRVQELWSQLVDPSRAVRSRAAPRGGERPEQAALFLRPVCLLAAKRGVERVLQLQYPRLFNDIDHGAALSQRIWDSINVMMMNIFDPDCQYASFGVLNGSLGAIRLERNLSVAMMKLGLTSATRMISSCFRTTPLVTLLMNADGSGPESPKTRKLLMKSSSDAVLSAVSGSRPGARRERAPGAPLLEAKRRASLYRTACTRLQSSGADILAGSASSSALERRRGGAR